MQVLYRWRTEGRLGLGLISEQSLEPSSYWLGRTRAGQPRVERKF